VPDAVTRRRKALVLGDDTRSFLATVRSLGRQGAEVHVAPADFLSPSLKSRYIVRVHRLPYYLDDGAEWLIAVQDLLCREAFDVVIPCDERTLLPFSHFRDMLSPLAHLAIPDWRAVDVLFDKHETRELARAAQVPVAAGRLVTSADTPDGLIAEFGLPMALKPRRSYELSTLYARGKVLIAADAASLAKALKGAEVGRWLAEGYLPGRGLGVSVLANQGRVLQAFQHRREREDASGSYYRVSAPLSPELVAACDSMVFALSYTGVAMFEFRLDDVSGHWALLEVNARPWGSMPLPLALGVDFIARWVRLLVDGVETPSVAYRVGVYGRNLIADLQTLRVEASRLRAQPAALLRFILHTLAEYGRVFVGREHHDVLVHDDPGPGLAEIGALFAQIGAALMRRIGNGDRRQRQRDRDSLERVLGNGTSVTLAFVCQGNICRSPFAEHAFRQALGTATRRLRIISAGMLPANGRSSPPEAVTTARGLGIDLTAHRSQHFSAQLAETSGLVIIFDEKNRLSLHRRYPELTAPVVLLGSFDEQELEIPDPDGGDLHIFQVAYAAVDRAIQALATRIQGSRSWRTGSGLPADASAPSRSKNLSGR
jgi:protein-tyrosine-phosphatase/predicted ATP-grasp superfamily ATP-dependent carboligase